MNSVFNASFFKNNRRQLQKMTGDLPIIITANGLLQMSGDQAHEFRQDSNFWYLTGLNEPDLILVIDGANEYLILPEREAWKDFFEGPISLKTYSKTSGIKDILNYEQGWRKLRPRIKKTKRAAGLKPLDSYVKHHGFYANPARQHLISKLEDLDTTLEIVDVRLQLATMRSIKQPQEIAALEQAINITVKTFKSVKKHMPSFKTERDVASHIMQSFHKAGVSSAYLAVVASGKNACTMHYTANNAKLSKSSLLLIDAGANFGGYAADITRTFAIGKPTKRQQQIFEAVKETQGYAISLLKPGIMIREYEQQIEKYTGEKLRELGVIKTANRKNVRQYFPTATSHFLGLDVHDAGDYDKPLKSGMVLTVEPGIYIPKEKLGVRIEDDVLITKNGSQVLSRALPNLL